MSQLAAAVSEASTRLSVSAAEKDASAAALATRLRMSEERLAEAVSKEVRLTLSSQCSSGGLMRCCRQAEMSNQLLESERTRVRTETQLRATEQVRCA